MRLRRKLTQEVISSDFSNSGCELLDVFVNSQQRLRFRCKCGEVGLITYNNFRVRRRCGLCGLRARSGPHHYQWKSDRVVLTKERQIKDRIHALLGSMKRRLGVSGSNSRLFGYSSADLWNHLTSHPEWSQISNGDWDVDHIFPIQAFLDHQIYDLKVINSLDNLRPVQRSANRSKRDLYSREEFYKWLHGKEVQFAAKE